MTKRTIPKWLTFFEVSLSKEMLWTLSCTIILILSLIQSARSDLLLAFTLEP